MESIEELIEKLYMKNNNIACAAMKVLTEESRKSCDVYIYFNKFVEMISMDNSYMRNRAIKLIAANAKWDCDNKIDEIIDEYLKHITDEKPITARQCIKSLAEIAKYKKELVSDIKNALENAQINKYADSMRPLIKKRY